MLSLYHKNFYHPSVCNYCKGTNYLKLCAQCGSISYCSKDHQRRDWSNHKAICKVIAATDKIYPSESRIHYYDYKGESPLFSKYYQLVLKKWEDMLNRKVNKFEKDMLMYRKTCLICYTKKAKLPCQCLSVFFCSEHYQEECTQLNSHSHIMYCKRIKLNFDLLLYNYNTDLKCIPKFSISKKITLKELPQNLNELIKYLKEKSIIIHIPKRLKQYEYVSIADMFAPAANILYGLEKSNLIENRVFSKNKLVVHIIGADEEERTWNWCLLLEFIFHWIKNLKHLTVIAVGPNAGAWNYSMANMSSVCGACNMNTTNIKCYSRPTYYHNVIEELEEPDIICAFNCSFSVDPEWHHSIPYFSIHLNVPFMLTDLGFKQIKDDVDILKTFLHSYIECETVLEPHQNPFTYLSPERADLNCIPIVNKNYIVTIVRLKDCSGSHSKSKLQIAKIYK